MKNKKFLLIIGAISIVIIWVFIKTITSPKNIIEKYDREIESLKEDILDINKSIANYYKKTNSEIPKYLLLYTTKKVVMRKIPTKTKKTIERIAKETIILINVGIIEITQNKSNFIIDPSKIEDAKSIPQKNENTNVIVDPVKISMLLPLLEKKLIYQNKLFKAHEQKGDYYLDELYRKDKTSPYYEYKFLGDKELSYALETKKKSITINTNEKKQRSLTFKTTDVIKTMIKTRRLAIDNYERASEAFEDKTSQLFNLTENSPVLFPIPLKLVNSKDILNQALITNQTVKEEYLTQRVKPVIHYKIGKAFMQIVGFAQFTNAKKDYLKKYLGFAEKEFLITLGIDENHSSSIYDLASLYNHRYLKFDDPNNEYMLKKAEELLYKLISNPKKNVHKENALFLLGKIYWSMGLLSKAKINNIQKLDNKVRISQLERLRKAESIFSNIMKMRKLSDKSDLYKKANKYQREVQKVIDRKEREGKIRIK
ncbi:MAG: hypothetical protein OEV44_05245 [Spirochaetota bacterium]|nr:hypothetical protein [Spirochaetota bacterium]